MEYKFLPALEKADLDEYVRLFDDCFGGDNKLNKEYLQWQYIDNPHGKVIGIDAFLGDELAAHYSLIPRTYYKDNQEYKAALSVNTATSPNHQGKGLFKTLAKATYEKATQDGVQFVVGVANANSIGGFIRSLEFEDLGSVSLYLQYKAEILPQGGLTVKRDENWLQWRLANPSRDYEILIHKSDGVSVRTSIGRYSFNIARFNDSLDTEALFKISGVRESSSLIPVFTPVFGVSKNNLFKLPARLQPSPWRVIVRSLDPFIDKSLFQELFFDGLSMDTF